MSDSTGDDRSEVPGRDASEEEEPTRSIDPSRKPDATDPEQCLANDPLLTQEIKNLFLSLPGAPGNSKEGGEPWTTAAFKHCLGNYKILRELGSGGMARVYEAEQLSLHRKVALKILPPHLGLSPKVVQRFRREAEACARQNHPGIVTIYEVGEDQGVQFIAQELIVDSPTLAEELDRIQQSGQRPARHFQRVADIIAKVAEAIVHAHQTGVTHNDVKPSNILIPPSGGPKVVDFGFAKIENALSLSITGEFLGTPYYMAPEQVEGRRKDIDVRTDVYSLGVTLYECLTLRRPFDGLSTAEVTRKILAEEPDHPARVDRGIPRDLAVICLKAMEKNPIHRYQSMAEMQEDLRRFLADEPILARPTGIMIQAGKWIRRHKLKTISMAAAFILIISWTILGYIISGHRAEKLAAVRATYLPVEEALQWDYIFREGRPWQWHIWIDPRDPGGYMLSGIYHLDTGDLKNAAEDFAICIDHCKKQGESTLEKDAHFLLSRVWYLSAESSENQEDRARYLKDARAQHLQAWPVDFLQQEHLAWRHMEPGQAAQPYASPIRLNSNHYLIHQYQGIRHFQLLYKGGEQTEFRDAFLQFEKVLESRPDDIMALTCYGRVQYFYARFYNYLHLLKEAEDKVRRALRLSGEDVHHLIPTTLGQIRLLMGDLTRAREYFQNAVNASPKGDKNLHNAYHGLGLVATRKNEYRKAWKYYNKASELMGHDPYVKAAFAEQYLIEKDYEQALEYAKKTIIDLAGGSPRETQIASALLISIRIHLADGNFEEAWKHARKIRYHAIRSPRDISYACILLATFPEEETTRNGQSVLSVAGPLATTGASFLCKDSPLGLSARGVAAYLAGNYEDALSAFQNAAKEREKWDPETRKYLWAEGARDHYFSAMVNCMMAVQGDPEGEERGRACYKEAESSYLQKYTDHMEYADIIERVRNTALRTLEANNITF